MKDPAVLFYISDWLTSTAEMDADCRGWYLNLLLHNYDKGSLSNDIETLANLAGVKFSEFARFKQVFEQVLKHKFEQTSEHRLNNPRTNEILRRREVFKEKRSLAGKTSYVLRYFKKTYKREMTRAFEDFVKANIPSLNIESINLKNEQVLKQVFEHLFELYRNGNGNRNKDLNKGGMGGKKKFQFPKLEEVKSYFSENGYKEEAAEKFFKYYEIGEWKDSKGNSVKNWKQKAQAVWFKDENKLNGYDPRNPNSQPKKWEAF